MLDITGDKQRNFTNAVILAAGKGERWKNYLGVPKQLVRIDGEPLMLRTIRQLKERGVKDISITVPKMGYYGVIPARQIIGIDEIEIDKFLNAEREVKNSTMLLWGDVYFTNEAMDMIMKDKNEWMFFGRKHRSEITGKNYGELFAVKVNKELLKKANELRGMAGKLRRCASWELYRLVNGYPLDKHIVEKNFTEINDWTDDFDYPKDYDIWIKKSKEYRKTSAFSRLHGYGPKRILHIGGHTGEEGELYKSIGAEFTFVEPVPEYAQKIRDGGYDVIEKAIGTERGEKDFNVRGLFSSLLIRRKEYLPYQERMLARSGEKKYQIKVKVIPLSEIQEGYDTLVVDTEGMVLDTLKSGNLNFKTMVIEESRLLEPHYEGEVDNAEIEKYLNSKGYIKAEKYYNNAIYIKKHAE